MFNSNAAYCIPCYNIWHAAAHVCDCATCSSQESAKAKTQKEVIKTLKELKLHLPTEKRHNNKSTTLNTLKYALRCVKQVEGKVFFPNSVCLSSLCLWLGYFLLTSTRCFSSVLVTVLKLLSFVWAKLSWFFPHSWENSRMQWLFLPQEGICFGFEEAK